MCDDLRNFLWHKIFTNILTYKSMKSFILTAIWLSGHKLVLRAVSFTLSCEVFVIKINTSVILCFPQTVIRTLGFSSETINSRRHLWIFYEWIMCYWIMKDAFFRKIKWLNRWSAFLIKFLPDKQCFANFLSRTHMFYFTLFCSKLKRADGQCIILKIVRKHFSTKRM